MPTFGPGEPQVVINSANWTMLGVSTVFLALRIYCRGIRSGQLWWDDYILIASWGLMVASTGVLTEMLRMGYLDYNMAEPRLFVLTRISHSCHLVSLALSKTSFAVTLLRFTTKWQKWLLWFIIGSILIIFTVHNFLLWRPMCGMPTNATLGSSCWHSDNAIRMNIVSSMYSAITDLVLALLPWKVIMSLNMKRSERINISIALSVGVIAGVTGLMKSIQSILTLDITNPNYMYQLALFWIFSLAEPNSTIIAASIPVLRALVRDVRTQIGGYSGSTPGASGYIRSRNNNFKKPADMSLYNDTVAPSGDAGSDRSILPHDSKSGAISRTTEVTVAYEPRNGSPNPGQAFGGESFEMQPRTKKATDEQNMSIGHAV